MKIFSSLHLLAALGALGAAAGASAQVDTSQWKCTSCPYPKGTTGSVDAGVGYVSDSSKKFGDYTGLDEKGAFLVLGGNVSRRGDDGYFADLWGADLGLDSRRLYGQAGREGLYSLNVGYAEIPRHLTDGAQHAVPRHRRQRADAAAGLSGRRHGQHAARRHAAAGRHRLQVQAPRSRRHLHRRTGLERQPEPAPRRARRDAAGVGIVLVHRVAVRRAGEREDRRRRAHGRLCDQATAGDGELPVLVLPQRRQRA